MSAPKSIVVSDGTHTETFPETGYLTPSSPYWIYLNVSSLGLSGNTISVTLNISTAWVFCDEIQFQGNAVPEPSSLVLASLASALGFCQVALRRRKRKRARSQNSAIPAGL